MSITIKNLQAFTKVAHEAYWEGIDHQFTFNDEDNQEYTFTLTDKEKIFFDNDEPETGYHYELTLLCNGKQYIFPYNDYDGPISNLEEIKPKVEPRWQKPFDELKTFLEANPDLRFWQALWAFPGISNITVNGQDPFHWEELVKPPSIKSNEEESK